MAATKNFKVGDMVIGNHPTRYGITHTGWIGRVTKVKNNGTFWAEGDEDVEFDNLEPQYFDLYTPEKITITQDGKTTVATLYKNNRPVESAEANCCPEDTFDFNVGAKLALERLVEKTTKPKGWTGKVVCIKSAYPWWTVGKIYEVKDGFITDEDGCTYPNSAYRNKPYIDANDARYIGNNKYNNSNEFIPLVE